MSLASRWTKSISRVGRDGLALSRAVYGAVFPSKANGAKTSLATLPNTPVAETIKSVLLREARRETTPNALAISLLKVDKEVGLIKYWGLAEYLRQNQQFFSLTSLSSRLFSRRAIATEKTINDGDATPAPGEASVPRQHASVAKVAFMITSSMKRELADGLGYSASVMKTMTPQQASLVLHHNLVPEAYEEQISELEKSFEEEKLRQQEQMEQQLQQTQQLQQDSPAGASAATTTIFQEASSIAESKGQSETSVRSSSPASESDSDGNSGSPLLLSSSDESPLPNPSLPPPSGSEDDELVSSAPFMDESINGDGDFWYEVVEIQEGTDPAVEYRHGLYKDKEEAQLGLETRQDIQNKREEATRQNTGMETNEIKRFVLRAISTNDLQ
jgi:hypothetical protein